MEKIWAPGRSNCEDSKLNLEERSNLILALVRAAFVNGQSTEQTLLVAKRFGQLLEVRVEIMARWGELQLHAAGEDGNVISAVSVNPVNVAMNRVLSAMQVVDDFDAGRLAICDLKQAIDAIS